MSTDTPTDATRDALGAAAPTTLSEAFHADAARLVRRYPVARSALLPLLHLVQSEHGYVSQAGIAECARLLDLTKAEVGAVATFYTMYKREPVGDYLLSVCTNPTCQIAGGQVIFDRYRDELGGDVRDPETGVTIEQAECLGICDAAPVVQVNYDMYGPLTDDEADRLFAGCRNGSPPASSWSGEPAPTFAEVERELSGADDAFGDALVEAARHSITGYDVPPSYKTGETDIPVTHPGGDRAGHGGEIFATAFDPASAPRAAGSNGHGPDGDPETARAADDESVTPDQRDDLDDVAAAAGDQADHQGDDRDSGDEAVDVADDAAQALDEPDDDADGTDGADQPGADPEMSTDEPAVQASDGGGDDDTSPDEVDSVADDDDDPGHDAPAPDQNEAGGA